MKPMYREILAGIAGFVVFNVATILLFYLSGYDPHAPVTRAFQVTSIVAGILFALVSGYLIGAISPSSPIRPAILVALVIAVFAIMSMLTSGSVEAWSQLAAIFLMAPALVVGARMSRRRIQPIDDSVRAGGRA